MFKPGNKHAMRMLVNILIVTLLLAATATPALAGGGPVNPNCWGVVTAQRATSAPGSMGEHASNQTEPRLGLANVARAFGFDHISDLGSFLAEIDGIEATQCP